MTISDQLADELTRLVGFAGPGTTTARAQGPDSLEITLQLTAVDRLSCGVIEIVAEVPKLINAQIDTLKAWGEALCKRLGYLLETLALLEIDSQNNEVLIRSNPPDRVGNTHTYYEVLLRQDGPGRFSLRRFESQRGGTRAATEMHLTHEVIRRLGRDLAETIPNGP